MKRLFDIIASFMGLLVLSPLLLLLSLLIVLESRGGVFYMQIRIGRNEQPFQLFKFRSMYPQSDQKGLLTVGKRDNRITRVGQWLRKYKLDELPQLWNVLKGDMSIVGPRPEVEKYVEHYSAEQRTVLQVRPGLTDYASLQYIQEDELLAKSTQPEQTYLKEILPEKLRLSQQYIEEQNFWVDLKIIFQTLLKIVR
jgi:lipopolysaccharide/colanic/teichoic acid biosynthesis glycosyltransferase